MATEIFFRLKIDGIETLLVQLGQTQALLDKASASAKQFSGSVTPISQEMKKWADAQKQIIASLQSLLSTSNSAAKGLDNLGNSMEGLGQGSADTAKEMAALEGSMQQMVTEANGLDLSIESNKVRYQELQAQLQTTALNLANMGNAAKQAGDALEGQQDTGSTFKSLEEGIVASMEALQGLKGILAENHFGEGSQAVENLTAALEAAEKGTQAMGITMKIANGIAAAWETVVGVATGKIKIATVAQELFNLAQKANPIGLIVGLIAGAVAAYATFASKIDKAAEEQKQFNDLQRAAAEETSKEIGNAAALFNALKKENSTREERNRALVTLNGHYGDYMDNLLTEKSSLEDIEAAQKQVNAAILQNVIARQFQEKANELLGKIVDKQLELNKANEDLEKGNASTWESFLSYAGAALSSLSGMPVSFKDAQEGLVNFQNASDVNSLTGDVNDLNAAFEKLPDQFNQIKENLKGAFDGLDLSIFTETVNDAIKPLDGLKQQQTKLKDQALELKLKQVELKKGSSEYNEITKELSKTLNQYHSINEQIRNAESIFDKVPSIDPYKKMLEDKMEYERENELRIKQDYENGLLSKEQMLEELAKREMASLQWRLSLAQQFGKDTTDIELEIANKSIYIKQQTEAEKLRLAEVANQKEVEAKRKAEEEKKRLEEEAYQLQLQLYDSEKTDREAAYQEEVHQLNESLRNQELSHKEYTRRIKDAEAALSKDKIAILRSEAEYRKAIFGAESKEYLDSLKALNDAELQMEAEKQQKKQEYGQQAMEVAFQIAQTTSDAIFEIQANDAEREKQHKLDALQKQLDLGLISQEEYEKKKKDIEKKAFDKKKKQDIIQAIVNGALAITQAFAQLGPIGGAIATAGIVANTAAQIAVISKQKFARGGFIPFQSGGMVQGPSHAQGGVSFLSNGRLMEAEGGELIVNRKIWQRPDFVRAISDMNAHTGGKRFFASGGIVPAPIFSTQQAGSANLKAFSSQELVDGLRGVISQEVGSIKVVNNVVDTSAQQSRLVNQQVDNSF
ncbi:MAG: hypothetical protein SFW35_00870 [Chitinophagales bacterium]|nr:hypothetical protein [Chitinophagales bacterium]